MSYAELGNKIVAIKKEPAAMEGMQLLTVIEAKETIKRIMNDDYIKEVEYKQDEDTKNAEEEQRVTLIGFIEEFIRKCETGERLKRKSTKTITPGTIKSYRGTLAQLKAYQEKRHKLIDFDDVTLDFYDDWRRFFLEKTAKRGNARPYSPNTIDRYVKNLKIFHFAAKDLKLTTTSEFESCRFSVNTRLYDEERAMMAAAEFARAKEVKLKIEEYRNETVEARYHNVPP